MLVTAIWCESEIGKRNWVKEIVKKILKNILTSEK